MHIYVHTFRYAKHNSRENERESNSLKLKYIFGKDCLAILISLFFLVNGRAHFEEEPITRRFARISRNSVRV